MISATSTLAWSLLQTEGMRSLLLVVVVATPALADPVLDPHATTWFGADLEVLPSGNLSRTAGFGQISEASAGTAYALGGLIEHRVSDALAIGFAPRVIWDIAPASDAVTSASSSSQPPTGKQIDLRLRAAYGTMISPRTRVYVYAAPGYAYGFEPSNDQHPAGAIAGGGLGVHYGIREHTVLTIDVGYQWGFQHYTDRTGDIRDRTSYLHIAFGIATAPAPDVTAPPAMASN